MLMFTKSHLDLERLGGMKDSEDSGGALLRSCNSLSPVTRASGQTRFVPGAQALGYRLPTAPRGLLFLSIAINPALVTQDA